MYNAQYILHKTLCELVFYRRHSHPSKNLDRLTTKFFFRSREAKGASKKYLLQHTHTETV